HPFTFFSISLSLHDALPIFPGLRAGHYLCFFGMHALTPAIMDVLGEQMAQAAGKDPVQLSPALAKLAGRERYLAMELSGQRHNIDRKSTRLNSSHQIISYAV